jgi:hypothetical protein
MAGETTALEMGMEEEEEEAMVVVMMVLPEILSMN